MDAKCVACVNAVMNWAYLNVSIILGNCSVCLLLIHTCANVQLLGNNIGLLYLKQDQLNLYLFLYQPTIAYCIWPACHDVALQRDIGMHCYDYILKEYNLY